MSKIRIIHGDCLDVLSELPTANLVFADPPDNLGCNYEDFVDKNPNYSSWLQHILIKVIAQCSDFFWLSYNHLYQPNVFSMLWSYDPLPLWHQFIWRYTFGQHRKTDCGSGYRPILRIMRPGAKLYPDAIRVPSARQKIYNDKRANPKGRVPDDVWEFPRVCGTFKERKNWHPCQHPKELLRRMVLLSTKPGDMVWDLFAGSGNMLEICRELDRDCIGIEISGYYCRQIAKEQGIKIEELRISEKIR